MELVTVTPPVEAESAMPLPAVSEVTPVLVKLQVLPANEHAIPEVQLLVVVATPVHAPLANVSTCPAVPANRLVVEIAVGAAVPPVRLATTVFAAWVASWLSANVPEMVESVEVAPE